MVKLFSLKMHLFILLFHLTESVKKTIRKTAGEFMTMVPMFSQRLAQRDYDFILVNPVKKRLLMKMYIMGKVD